MRTNVTLRRTLLGVWWIISNGSKDTRKSEILWEKRKLRGTLYRERDDRLRIVPAWKTWNYDKSPFICESRGGTTTTITSISALLRTLHEHICVKNLKLFKSPREHFWGLQDDLPWVLNFSLPLTFPKLSLQLFVLKYHFCQVFELSRVLDILRVFDLTSIHNFLHFSDLP